MRRSFLAFLAFLVGLHGQNPQTLTLQAPPPPAVSQAVATPNVQGPATYFYWVVARWPIGNAPPLGPVTTTTAPNTLSASNFVTISWAGNGASSYDVLKTPTASLPGSCTCLLTSATTSGSTIDTGQALAAYTVSGTGAAAGSMAVNNRDYISARFTFTLPLQLLSGGISFPDNTTQTTAYTGGVTPGTVTSFSAGNAAPLFTTSVATSTTTPALSFSLSSAAANLVFASPDGAPGAGAYRALVAADLPATGVTASTLLTSTFAALATPAAGSVRYCSDCTVTSGVDNTCAGAGTGAFAIRLNGAWKCVQ